MTLKTDGNFIPGPITQMKTNDAKFDYFSYSIDLEDGKHICVGLRRPFGYDKIEATIFTGPTIEKQEFERYELDFKYPDAKWSKQKQWLFPWAQYFVWKTDEVAEMPNNEDQIAKHKAEIDKLQREVLAMTREDKQRYKDVPLPPFAQPAVAGK